jgi:hypothetical protein
LSKELDKFNDTSPEIENSPEQNEILWNIISPLFRVVVLKQTQLSNESVSYLNENSINHDSSTKYLDWNYLPSNVQSILSIQKGIDLFNLKFSDWGWTNYYDDYANLTLISILPEENKYTMNSIFKLIEPLRFNTSIDSSIVYNNDLNGLFMPDFDDLFYNSFRFKRNIKDISMPHNILIRAVNEAKLFLNSRNK